MIALDEDALICDLAETYHIYNMESFSPVLIATLAEGLGPNSRIRLKRSGLSYSLETLLLAHVADNTAFNVYAKTKDARHGRDKPRSMLAVLNEENNPGNHAMRFNSGSDFMKKWRELNGN